MTNNLFQRWSQRKLQSQTEPVKEDVLQQSAGIDEAIIAESEPAEIGAEAIPDKPCSDQLNTSETGKFEQLSIANLLTSEADKSVKKAALRKLFMNGEFNQLDDLTDTNKRIAHVKTLAPEIAEKVRGWTKTKLEELIEEEPLNNEIVDDKLVVDQSNDYAVQGQINEGVTSPKVFSEKGDT